MGDKADKIFHPKQKDTIKNGWYVTKFTNIWENDWNFATELEHYANTDKLSFKNCIIEEFVKMQQMGQSFDGIGIFVVIQNSFSKIICCLVKL